MSKRELGRYAPKKTKTGRSPANAGDLAALAMIHAGIYTSCWYLLFMLVFTLHAGIYYSCWYLHFMLVYMIHAGIHAGIYDSCWYLRFMQVFTTHAGIYDTAGIYTSS